MTAAARDAATQPQVAMRSGAALTSTLAAPDLGGLLQSLQLFLKIERDARQAKTLEELWFLAANDSRRALQARQIFVLEPVRGGCRMRAISSLSIVDRDSPTVRWLERLAHELAGRMDGKPLLQASISSLQSGAEDAAQVFPFPHAMIASINAAGKPGLAYLLSVRETPFGEADAPSAERLAEAFGHAAMALGGYRRQARRKGRRLLAPLCGLAAAAALLFIPVPMVALAPAEVVARDGFIVTAPLEGVIDQIVVEPNQPVYAGDILVRLADVAARNQLEIAEQEVAVAEAKWRQISLAAFNDPAARRELTAVTTERALKRAERDYARDLLSRTVIRADRPGVALYADKRELVGRPVQTGMRLMEIADPASLRIRAQVPLDDAMALRAGARLKLFPDADPLHPVEARLTDASHQARQADNGAFAFRVDADVPESARDRLRIGHRGTAQIFGETVSLGFYLFRRPLSAFRQKFGL